MSCMFYGCSSLIKINIFKFNDFNVINMNRMFCGCSSLKEINLSNFNINYANNMKGMFFRCPRQFEKEIKEKVKNIKEEAFTNNYWD